MPRDSVPARTMFERCVVSQQPHLEIGRRYIQAFGFTQGINALVDDMDEGRLPWVKGQQVLGLMHYLFVEYIVRRVGFRRFSDVLGDSEYRTLQEASVTQEGKNLGPIAPERYARALETFAWTSVRHWHLVAHDRGGRHIYEITPELARLLRQTQPLEEPWRT